MTPPPQIAFFLFGVRNCLIGCAFFFFVVFETKDELFSLKEKNHSHGKQHGFSGAKQKQPSSFGFPKKKRHPDLTTYAHYQTAFFILI